MTTKQEEESTRKTTTSWGTWEELVLACAVKRHGLKNWESVAMEVQTKTSLPHLLTSAQFCEQKYMDLKRRFHDSNDNNNIPWLEQLRKVRVDELKQDLQRYDLSIHCLQLKVKRLEEERERDNNNTNTDPEPDLNQPNILQNDNNKQPAKSERDNRSVNESNSTGLSDKGGDGGGDLVKSEAEPLGSGGEGGGRGGTTKAEESDELAASVTQLSSDVQSSASYDRKESEIGTGGDAKSEPLIRLLDVIRTHKHASLFERRLRLQESRKYKEIVRQHVDLETMQTRVEQGIYSSCHLNFYRDVLLLFNNAIVVFPKSSLESATAHELRRLVSVEVDKETRTYNPDSSQEPQPPKPQLQRCDSLLDKQKSTAPIVVCRKRSSVSAKPSSTFAQKPDPSDDDKKKAPSIGLLKLKTQEKAIITGTRSSRRNTNNKNPPNNGTPPPPSNNKKQSSGSASVDKQEVSKRDNKKKTDKKKSVVDFLKRIKKNSPVQSAKKGSEGPKRSNNNNTSGKKEKEERQSSGSGEKKQRTSSPKKNVGRPPKKAADTTPVTRKRAREVVVAKRQTKRARR